MRLTAPILPLMAVATLLLAVAVQAQPSNIDQCISNCTDASIQNEQALSLCTTGDRNAQFACICSTRVLRAALEGCVAGACVDVHDQAVAKLDSECDDGVAPSSSSSTTTTAATGTGSSAPVTTTSVSSESSTTSISSSIVVAGGPTGSAGGTGTGTGTGEPSAPTGSAASPQLGASIMMMLVIAIVLV